jgi:hypothetical protein
MFHMARPATTAMMYTFGGWFPMSLLEEANSRPVKKRIPPGSMEETF